MSDKTYSANLESCDPSDCASCTANCSSAGSNHGTIPNVPNPTIKLTLDDDSVLECAVLTTFPVEALNENGKNTTGETYLFRYAEDGDNPVITNIEREDEYMAAAEAFHDFIANLKTEAELAEEE